MRAGRARGRVLQADEQLAISDTGADVGELEGDGGGHGYIAAQKRKPPEGGLKAKGSRSRSCGGMQF